MARPLSVSAGARSGLLAQGVNTVSQLTYLVVVSRLYSVRDFGIYAGTVALCGMVGMVLGLQLEHQAARAQTHAGRQVLARGAASASAAIALTLVLVAAITAVTATYSASTSAIVSYIPAAALGPYMAYLSGVAAAEGSAAAATSSKWLLPLARLAMVFALPWWFPSSPAVLASAESVATVLAFVATLWMLGIGTSGLRLVPNAHIYTRAVQGSLPFIASGSAWFAIQRLDILIMAAFGIPPDEIGQYQIALRLADIVLVFYASSLIGLIPSISSRPALSRRTYEQIGLAAGPPLAIAVGALAAVGAPVASIAFGSQFAPSATLLLILAAGVAVHTLSGPTGLVLLAVSKDRAILIISTVAVLSNLLLNLALIPHFAALGAAIATVSSLAILNLGYMVALRGHDPAFPTSLAKVSGLSVSILAASLVTHWMALKAGIPAVSAAAVVPMSGIVLLSMFPSWRRAMVFMLRRSGT